MKISICRVFLVMTAVFVCAVFFSYSGVCYKDKTYFGPYSKAVTIKVK